MSDNLRRYRAIRDALKYAYPTPPIDHFARHLNTLAALISESREMLGVTSKLR
jgi:hypothetical protein